MLGSAGPELAGAGDLRTFKAITVGAMLLSLSFGVMSADGAYVFVEPEWIRQHAGDLRTDPGWLEQFESMFRYAAECGWTDDAGRLRAHVERADLSDLLRSP